MSNNNAWRGKAVRRRRILPLALRARAPTRARSPARAPPLWSPSQTQPLSAHGRKAGALLPWNGFAARGTASG